MVDFSKRLDKGQHERPLDPSAIYDGLDRAVDSGPLRPAQAAVLKEWHEKKRTDQDLILKMHTGQGKTLVGLLILQSKLNEKAGPALYLCPNKYLVEQTCDQARKFGVRTCTAEDALPAEFPDSTSILVTTVQKLFNGLTRFGTDRRSTPVGAIVVDDAHASVDAIRAAFRVRIPRLHPAFKQIVGLFGEALQKQGAGSFEDIQAENHHAFLCVPYWEWRARQEEIVRILASHAGDECIKFQWPLIKDALENCQCVVCGTALEIEPYLAPLDHFGSFCRASHRVFMSATTADDSFLLKGLRVNPAAIRDPLVYRDEKWSGEKMVLIPSLIDSTLDRSAIVNALGQQNPKRTLGVVILVPADRLTRDWQACGAVVATKETLESEIQRLRRGDFAAPLVLVNRYDGIDLPDNLCRILVFDSTPYSDSLCDRYADHCRAGSDITALRTAKRIEQGLGRSVRGEKDYSVIILIGDDLVRTVRGNAPGRRHLSSQTQAQIEIGLEIAEMAKEEIVAGRNPLEALTTLINQCLKRDKDWKQFYAERMDAVTPGHTDASVLDILDQELRAETEFQAGKPEEATRILQGCVDKYVRDDEERGWYLQDEARYLWPGSRIESEKLQAIAHRKNRLLLRPRAGMVFVPISPVSEKRVAGILAWIRQFDGYEDLRVHVDEMLGDLAFGVIAERFERALDSVGKALGFGSQRPDKEYKEGPDNLWAVRDGEYVLFECKSEVNEQRAEINKAEVGQMNTSCAWFASNYPGAAATKVMVHPASLLGKGAHFTEKVRIMRKNGLRDFVKAVRALFGEFKAIDLKSVSEKRMQELLNAHGLGTDFIEKCTRAASPLRGGQSRAEPEAGAQSAPPTA